MVADAYVSVTARAGHESRALMAPATLGAHACSIFHSYSAGVQSSPTCAVTLTAIGARIEGTLTVGADAGSFSVTRVAYP